MIFTGYRRVSLELLLRGFTPTVFMLLPFSQSHFETSGFLKLRSYGASHFAPDGARTPALRPVVLRGFASFA
ncbi:hypothetical protein [Methanoculleus chikugoensis]|uniref:hypothetical protein n=1 Tax=Methanoculleus chikugoensis TaxID=118126 RepID=UPI0006D1BD58|nr:hypothetical protein [Methanoculleus chikugoensis]